VYEEHLKEFKADFEDQNKYARDKNSIDVFIFMCNIPGTK